MTDRNRRSLPALIPCGLPLRRGRLWRSALRGLALRGLALTAALCSAAGAGDALEAPNADTAGLLPGLQSTIDLDGTLEFLETGTDQVILSLLVIEGDPAARSRRHLGTDTRFLGLASEGMAGGARGFSAQADDDRDAATDEDPLDGRDNDQDGWVDEDFAAIGDTMVVVDDERAGRILHREFYRWTNGHLSPAVFLSVRRAGPAGEAWLRAEGDAPWVETGITCCPHTIGGQPQPTSLRAFVTRVEAAPGGMLPGGIWLGLVILDQETRGKTDFRILMEEERLDLPLAEEPLPVAVCAGESWLQLCNLLGEAARVYQGVADPVSGRQAGWIVPARCVRCRLAEPLEFRWNWTATGSVILWTDSQAGHNPLLDPDLFRVGGQALGGPVEVAWTPRAGAAAAIPWAARTLQDLNLKSLRPGSGGSADLGRDIPDWFRHEGAGRASFRFDGLPPEALDLFLKSGIVEAPLTLTGKAIGGRSFTATLTQDTLDLDGIADDADARGGPAGQPGVAATPGARVDPLADRSRLKLSPDLLSSWPNPFRDRIQIRFQVPRTVQEAFVWDGPTPAGVDLQAEVPWKSGQPFVTVKIYSVDGLELATVFSGRDEGGQYTVSWDARDSSGRPVASGTYFCKLQLDDLSVTRRIVYLR